MQVMRETLNGLTPFLRRYAHALLGSWPCAQGRDDGKLRPDQEADDIVQRALLGFLRAGAHFDAQRLRLAAYRGVTELARENLARRRFEEIALAAADSGFASHHAWAPEARALPTLPPNLRALLALAVLERLSYAEVADVLEMETEQVLPRLAVARAQLASAISGAARMHLATVAAVAQAAPSGGPVAEADLHLFVDEGLDPDRAEAVSAWLEHQPAAARRVAEWRRHCERLRAAFQPLIDEPLPPSLNFCSPDAAFWAQRRSARPQPRRESLLNRLSRRIARVFAPRGGHAHA